MPMKKNTGIKLKFQMIFKLNLELVGTIIHQCRVETVRLDAVGRTKNLGYMQKLFFESRFCKSERLE